jgi:hypothetical protein
MRALLRFACPSCGTKFRPIESNDAATVVVRRTCTNPACRETWRLIVKPLRVSDNGRVDKADLTYVGRPKKGGTR